MPSQISYLVYRTINLSNSSSFLKFLDLKRTGRCHWLCYAYFHSQPIAYAKQTTKSRDRDHGKNLYSDTVNLPKTEFPISQKLASPREIQLQSDLAIHQMSILHHGHVMEDVSKASNVQIQNVLTKNEGFTDLYPWQRQQTERPEFVLHDGPPYANGAPHVGHAVNKVLKDITNRYKLLTGHRVHYRPGWDCHGLPIEHKVLSEHNLEQQSLTPLQIRHKAEKFARETIHHQQKAFKRWGILGDWGNPYLTMDKGYEGRQLQVFADMYQKGLVYRDYMPVYWSPSSRTALAEAELEYKDDHVSQAVYVRFPLTTIPASLQHKIGDVKNVYVVIWTTTPWTLPANQAIAFSHNVEYTISKCGHDAYITSSHFTPQLHTILSSPVDHICTLPGAELEGCKYSNRLTRSNLPLVSGDHVTPDKGTGLVHTAPAHGHDDFHVAIANNLPVECMVGEDGRYTNDIDCPVAGAKVMGEVDQIVIRELGEDVIHTAAYTHSYPYDWRTKQPVIIRASQQWFIDTKQLLHSSQDSLKHVCTYPTNVDWAALIRDKLESRPYWCISRQRAWGVPIPVFYHSDTGKPIINEHTLAHVISLVQTHGSDCWWTLPTDQLFPSHLLSQCRVSSIEQVHRGSDILDIWFDSGVSWASVLPEGCPRADMYLEGIDQLGGWFQTSLLTSVALNNAAPYKTVVVHGFAMDESGRKMSKSVGNVVDPEVITDGGQGNEPAFGADALRWWVAVSGLDSNIYIGPNIMQRCNDTLYAIRKAMRYQLGNLSDFDMTTHEIGYDDMLPQDKYMLHLLHEFVLEMRDHYDNINYSWAALSLERFINSHLSNFYFTIIKDRCYCDGVDTVQRRSCQSTLYHTLHIINTSMAPILPHMAEETYSYYKENRDKMLFHGSWPTPSPEWHNPSIAHLFNQLISIRDVINTTLVSRPSVRYHAFIECDPSLLSQLQTIQAHETDAHSPISEVLQTATTTITSHIEAECEDIEVTSSNIPGCTKIVLRLSDLGVCGRCRRYTATTSGTLCDRCTHVVDQLTLVKTCI